MRSVSLEPHNIPRGCQYWQEFNSVAGFFSQKKKVRVASVSRPYSADSLFRDSEDVK
jgi:hypothetical protein